LLKSLILIIIIINNNNNNTHIFYPVAIETEGAWNHWAVELVQELGRRATLITGVPISAVVNSPPTGKFCLIPQHL